MSQTKSAGASAGNRLSSSVELALSAGAGSSAAEQGTFNPRVLGSNPSRPSQAAAQLTPLRTAATATGSVPMTRHPGLDASQNASGWPAPVTTASTPSWSNVASGSVVTP